MAGPRYRSAAPLMENLEERRLLAAPTVLLFNGFGGGVANTGFTSVQATSRGKGLVRDHIKVRDGKLLVTSTKGDFSGPLNNQANALQLPLRPGRNFSAGCCIISFPFTANRQNAGVFVGTGEDNYVKLSVGYKDGTNIRLVSESGGALTTGGIKDLSLDGIERLYLRLIGSKASGTVTAQYRIESADSDDWISIGQVTNHNVFKSGVRAGIATTNFGARPFTAAYDCFSAASSIDLPFLAANLEFNGNDAGVMGSGFGNVLPTTGGRGLVSENFRFADGQLILTSTDGDFIDGRDNQDNALYFESNLSQDWVIETRLNDAPFDHRLQSAGIWVGSSQRNYVKVIGAYSDPGRQIIELSRESSGALDRIAQPSQSFAGVQTLDLRLVGNAQTKTITAYSRVNSSSESAWVTVGQTTSASAFSASTKAGILTTSNAGPIIEAPFEYFRLNTDAA